MNKKLKKDEQEIITKEDLKKDEQKIITKEDLKKYTKKILRKLAKKNKIILSYKNKKTGKRKDFTKDELINKLLELNNTLNLDDIKEDKLEKKTSKSKKKISKEKKSGNNETLGISAEVAFCKTYNLNYPQ